MKHSNIFIIIGLILVWLIVVVGGLGFIGYKIEISQNQINILSPVAEKSIGGLENSQNNSSPSTFGKIKEKIAQTQENIKENIVNNNLFNNTQQLSNKINLKRNIDYYEITGSDIYELSNSMDQNGPKLEKGVFHAAVMPDIDYEIDCKGNYEINVEIGYIYPMWNRPEFIYPNTEDIFNQYLYYLDIHERGHEEIVLQAANKIEIVLKQIDNSKNCLSQNLKAVEGIEEIIQEHNYLQSEYDRITNHGETQGAYLYY